MPDLPAGALTFLFTDIEGSTRLWEEHPEPMRAALAQHDDLLRACIESHDGRVFKTVGDAFCAVFANPRSAVETVLASQQWLPALALQTPEGARPLKVRMALHAGITEERDGDYFGPPLNRVARLLAVGHGGQVLLSAAARAALDVDLPAGAALQNRGRHRLRDLGEPEQVFQLLHQDLVADFPPLRSLSTHPNNLPQQVTSFIGREREIAELRGLMERTRLLTLTGSGGCGKTRLALHVGAEALEQFADGVWVVELAPLSDHALVPQTVASALGLKEEPGKSLTQTIVDYAQSRQLLLLLDNCEHLLEGCARLADAILSRCPGARVLATSREGLATGGELTYRVPSLPAPDPQCDVTPEAVERYEAVRLFVERAQFYQPQFGVMNQNAAAVGSICHRLDGIPLAIELAAARVRAMPVEQIEQRLDQRFRLLTGGSRTALPRQQTLRSLIDWSYDLLNEAEQALLVRLSVFAGGWTLEAAEEVCSDERKGERERWRKGEVRSPIPHSPTRSLSHSPILSEEVLDLLASLVDKSLVVYSQQDASARYHLLETVRQYSQERLAEYPGNDTVRKRHCAYYLDYVCSMQTDLWGNECAAAFDQLELEHANLRASLDWCASHDGGVQDELRFVGVLGRFWNARGHLQDGMKRLQHALRRSAELAPNADRASALGHALWVARLQGDYPAARAFGEETTSIYEALGDRRGAMGGLNLLGIVAIDAGQFGDAQEYFERALVGARENQNVASSITALHNLGCLAYRQRNVEAARAYFLEAGRLGPDGDVLAANSQALALIEMQDGKFDQARALLTECLHFAENMGGPTLAEAVSAFGLLACAQSQPLRAARLLGASESIWRAMAVETWGPLGPDVEAARAELARTCDGEAAANAWDAGAAMTAEQAVAYALEAGDA